MRCRLASSLLGVLVLFVATACSEGSGTPAAPAPPSESVRTTAALASPAAEAAPAPARRERPLPAFSGRTLDDRSFDVSSWIGRRFLVFFFNPEVDSARPVGAAVRAVAAAGREYNFGVLGVAQGSSREKTRAFLDELGLEIPVVEDPSGTFGARIGLRVPVGLLLVDAEGYMVRASAGMEGAAEAERAVEETLREWLRLPGPETSPASLDGRPRAPDFTAERLDGGRFTLSSLRGRPVVIVFFLHTCPHCHHALAFFREALAKLPEATRPQLIGISVVNRTLAVEQALKEEGLDFFPVLMDADGSIRSAYGAVSGVPVIVLVDREGRIVARGEGWRDDRDPPLMRMRLAQLAGEPVPMLLHATGYSGNEFCAVCHEAQAATWELTNHAHAFDTLVRHGAERRGECVGCHVVGFGQPGGYRLDAPSPTLEDVGCETCHGRGGPHLSPEAVTAGNYEPVCVTCHDTEHSLGFEYAAFVPRVSHRANADLASLSPEERERVLAERRKPRTDLLPTTATYVGSAACQSCHEAEYATWSKQPHAHALASLTEKGKAGDADCLACHTTAYGRPGGFPAGGEAQAHPDLAVVGCESCHGPGGDHVAEGARRLGTIVSLGDKCDSCVILQICGSCHDDANDPGFEYEVLDKIEAQRHGTIEAGTGKPLAPSAALPASAVTGALERALHADPEAG